jgi:hypothetical protein
MNPYASRILANLEIVVLMPIFHEHGLIFVHIPKNAGKSVEAAFLGKGSENAGRRSKLNAAMKLLLRWTGSPVPRRDLLGSLDFTFAAQHMTIYEMTSLGLVSTSNCPGYGSFAVVRNPFDRVISSVFHHFSRDLKSRALVIDGPDSFGSALRRWLEDEPRDHNHIAHKRNQFDFLTLNGRDIGVDHLIRYERLSVELNTFCEARSIPAPSLGWSGRNARNREYRDYFRNDSRRILEKHFGQDLDTLRYTF